MSLVYELNINQARIVKYILIKANNNILIQYFENMTKMYNNSKTCFYLK